MSLVTLLFLFTALLPGDLVLGEPISRWSRYVMTESSTSGTRRATSDASVRSGRPNCRSVRVGESERAVVEGLHVEPALVYQNAGARSRTSTASGTGACPDDGPIDFAY